MLNLLLFPIGFFIDWRWYHSTSILSSSWVLPSLSSNSLINASVNAPFENRQTVHTEDSFLAYQTIVLRWNYWQNTQHQTKMSFPCWKNQPTRHETRMNLTYPSLWGLILRIPYKMLEQHFEGMYCIVSLLYPVLVTFYP